MTSIRRYLRDQAAATAIEYGLLAALVAIAVLMAVSLLGDPVEGLLGGVAAEFDEISEKL